MLTDGRAVGAATTDDSGRFYLKIDASGAPFVVAITRIGMRPTLSDHIMAGKSDSLFVDLDVREEGIIADTVRVTAAPGLNERRLDQAVRRGWKVFPPVEIAQVRDHASSFEDLLRSTGYAGFVIPSRRQDCIRSTRNNRCLTIVLDGVPLIGSYPLINPRDVYFIAVLSPNQAQLEYGEKAFYGAIVVQTRAYGDSYDRDG